MISLTQFRYHCMPLFRVMRDSHTELEIVYEGKVYEMSIREIDKEPRIPRPRVRKVVPQVRKIDTDICPSCNSLRFNNICMNRECIHASGTVTEAAEKILD